MKQYYHLLEVQAVHMEDNEPIVCFKVWDMTSECHRYINFNKDKKECFEKFIDKILTRCVSHPHKLSVQRFVGVFIFGKLVGVESLLDSNIVEWFVDLTDEDLKDSAYKYKTPTCVGTVVEPSIKMALNTATEEVISQMETMSIANFQVPTIKIERIDL